MEEMDDSQVVISFIRLHEGQVEQKSLVELHTRQGRRAASSIVVVAFSCILCFSPKCRAGMQPPSRGVADMPFLLR